MSNNNKLKFYEIEIQRLKKEKELLKIELDVRKREPYWENECISVAKKYGWSFEQGFPQRRKQKHGERKCKGENHISK